MKSGISMEMFSLYFKVLWNRFMWQYRWHFLGHLPMWTSLNCSNYCFKEGFLYGIHYSTDKTALQAVDINCTINPNWKLDNHILPTQSAAYIHMTGPWKYLCSFHIWHQITSIKCKRDRHVQLQRLALLFTQTVIAKYPCTLTPKPQFTHILHLHAAYTQESKISNTASPCVMQIKLKLHSISYQWQQNTEFIITQQQDDLNYLSRFYTFFFNYKWTDRQWITSACSTFDWRFDNLKCLFDNVHVSLHVIIK